MTYNTFIREQEVDGETNWLWPIGDNGAWDGPHTDWINHHKPNILKFVKNFDVVIQAGGNCGMYPRLLSNMFKTVYTFEPDDLNFHCLVNNCQKENIVKINAALGASHNFIKVKKAPITNVGMHKVEIDEEGFVPQFMVDDLNLNKCDLLMLDVEGYERSVIEGATITIENFKPVIFAENGNNRLLPLIDYLGYKIVGQSMSDTIYSVE